MAPVPEAYFPSLDKCFSGDVQLLSWKRAFLYTCNPNDNIDNAESLHAFLSHPETTQLLSNALNTFPSASGKSKSAFESKTAAIHSETSTNASYNLEEIKADALWLSEKAGIDELSALRITVLEWQNRPATRLLSGFTDEETTSLQGAAGPDNFRVSLAGPSIADLVGRRVDYEDSSGFASESNRRLRLRELYLSERVHIVKTARKLLALFLQRRIHNGLPGNNQNDRDSLLSDLGSDIFEKNLAGDEWRSYLQACVKAIKERLSVLEGEGGWLGSFEGSEESEAMWRTTYIEEILHITQILFLQLQASTEIPGAELLLSWLRLMVDYNFLESVSVPCPKPVDILLPLQGFVCLTTLALMKLPLSISAIINKTSSQEPSSKLPYFLSKDNVSEINELFVGPGVDSKTANPAAFAWGLVLHTIRELAVHDRETRELEQFHSAVDSFQSNTPHSNSESASKLSVYEEVIDTARTPQYTTDEAIALLSSDAMREIVFETIVSLATKVGSTSAVDDALVNAWTRGVLLDLTRTAVVYLDYSSEIVHSVLAILTGPSTEPSWPLNTLFAASNHPRSVFMKDHVLMDSVFRLARSRFPYETAPFLKICRALVSKELVNEEGVLMILHELENMETFTQVVPPGFHGYETIREDENANFVSLISPLPMIESTPKSQLLGYQASNDLIVTGASQIPSRTAGQAVSESRPAVIMWYHRYSCLSYLGSWLEEWNENGGYSIGSEDDCSAEIIGLFADLLDATQNSQAQADDGSSAKRILELASDGLSRQSDIISVIFEIFERNLSNVGTRAGSELIVECSISCIRFISSLVAILPGRVWPFLSRSSLLGSDGKGGTMTAIVSALEITSGNYPFLFECVNLFEAVVNDAAFRAVMRKSPNSLARKMATTTDWTAGVPSHMMRGILLHLVRTMVEVYNSNGNWRFNSAEQRLEINTILAQSFERVLYYTFGANDNPKLDAKITGVFSSSAVYILDVLRPQSTADLPFNPILRLIVDGLQTPPTAFLRSLQLVTRQVKSTLELSTRLLQSSQLLELPPSLLEEQLFKATPVLIKLYALHDAYRLPVLHLLNTLISGAARNSTDEPPSLVGHLGADAACLFLDVLSQFDKPLSNRSLHLSGWNLLSTIVSKRQQWLAVYILTGSSPRDRLKKTDTQKSPAMRGTPFLQMALESVSDIEHVDFPVALALLQFISNAQENWPWATPELKKHPHFFTSIVNYVSTLNIPALPVEDQIFTTRIAAVVADICAVYMHSAKEMQDRSFYKTLIPLVTWYAKNAVEVPGYNASLHANLKKNFEARYSGCKLVDFKRTPLQPRSLGPEYYYDLHLGSKLLSYDSAWAGKRNQGFASEFERANINLSLVEAQVGLLHSWKFFAIEHCSDFMVDRQVQKSMSIVVQNCLEANTRGVPQEAIFERIQQVRVDFAQALLQKLVEIEARGAEVFSLLSVVCHALHTRRATYEEALINDDTEYYRSLLNVLFLALQFHLDSPSRSAPEAITKKTEVSSDLGLVVDVVKTVVAQGFKTLTSWLHDQPDKCTPRDFAILTAIMQSALQVKNVDRLYEHMVYHIADNDTVRHATSLFSWADQLAVGGDPVYGELSIAFLVKLSTIPMLAEHLAVETVLSQLSTSRLTDILRQPKGFGAFDPVPRLYTIWTQGFLPLCLNLLYHVIRTAPEVAAFLNQFENQLTRASESFASRTVASAGSQLRRISASMASEAYSLALISFILDQFRQAGASVGIDSQTIQELKWDKAQVKEDIEELLERKQSLRSRIVPTTEKEVELMRQKPANVASGTQNRLEEKIVSQLRATVICLGGEEA